MDTSIMKSNEIINMDLTDWHKVAIKMRGYIVTDMDKGKLQGRQGKYSNKGAGVGWRTIKVKGKNKPIFIDSYKNKKSKGFDPVRPKNLEGQSLNRHTRSVNMKLTGETQSKIIAEGKKDGAYVIFGNADIIKGNEKRGYIIRDLNNRNKAKTVKVVTDRINKRINTYHKSKDININIG